MLVRKLSIVIPTLNEEGNIQPLLSRISEALDGAKILWEAIFIDDHSADRTVEILREQKEFYPLKVFLKQGKRGKAYSLLEGFARAKYPVIAMLDADLQYPPEALPEMIEMIAEGKADIVVANRKERETSPLRRFLSRNFRFFFGKFLHGLSCDVQSGLKVFRRKILSEVKMSPTPWTFDLEFLLSARNYGYIIAGLPITFAERREGQSKIHFLRAVVEIGWNALKLRLRKQSPLFIAPEEETSMLGAGVAHNRQRFITHTTLGERHSALHTFTPWQRNLIVFLASATLIGLLFSPLMTGIVIIGILSTIYFVDVLFNLHLVLKSLRTPPEIEASKKELLSIGDEELPLYSILCPLYKEAHMLPGFVAAIEKFKWPKEKLDVLLLLEENDPETVAAAEAMALPEYIRIIVVPHSMPKTKPKACNYGLSLARGEYVVIYDAEDIPDPWQLRKAYAGFQKAGPKVKCLQAKLNYFNPSDNLLTRFFTAEYSLWFDIILVGLQSINTSIPLGGTSNHFRTKDLLELEGWDPFNVTEDCDLGVRIFKRGFNTAIIDSVTLEEANGHVRNWLRQRSRWIKGYMQTYLVHMRHPFQFVRENGFHALYFQLTVGGKIAFLFINPILWLSTVAYFTLYVYVGPSIQALYPPLVFYMAAISLVFGNFLHVYYYMLGCAKRRHWSLMKYVFLVPVYWILGSIAAYKALYELLVKPHYWQKTTHGLHLKKKEVTPQTAGFSFFPTFSPVKVARTLAFQTEEVVRKTRNFFTLPRFPKFRFALPKISFRRLSKRPLRFFYGFSFSNQRDFWVRLETRLKKFVTPSIWNFVFSNKGVFMMGLMLSYVVNFFFNVFLGRFLSFEELSLVTLINTLWLLITVFTGAFTTTVNHRTSILAVKRGKEVTMHFLKKISVQALAFSLILSGIWVGFAPTLAHFFQLQTPLILLFFTPVFVFGIVSSGYRGYLLGNHHFSTVSALYVGEVLLKFGLAGALVVFGLSAFAYLSIPLSIVVTAIVAFLVTPWITGFNILKKAETEESFPKSFFAASFLSNLSVLAFLSVDIFLVNHYFEPRIAGEYALLSLVGKMIFFLGSLPNVFMITLVSREEGLGRDTNRIFTLLYSMTLGVVASGVVFLGVLGPFTIPFLFGTKASAILSWLLPYTSALALFTMTSVLVTYHVAKRHYSFAGAHLLLSGSLLLAIMTWHRSIQDLVWAIFTISALGWVAVQLYHFFLSALPFLTRSWEDFLGIFHGNFSVPRLSGSKRKILVFNWRDLTHAYAGGAEVYVHEVAKAWVKEGHHVTIFAGNDGTQKRTDRIDGVRIIRRGGFYLVYLWAFFYYIFRFRDKFDFIVDCENGIPFFTPLYTRTPVFCLMHHVHQNVFFRSLPAPLAQFASFLEKDLMPLVYRNVRFITVSQSSKQEMEAIGLGHAGIQVVHPGINHEIFSGVVSKKTTHPTILYLGRLKAYKSVDVLLRAFRRVLSERPDARLIIAGSGDEEERLVRLARDLHLTKQQIYFVGQVGHDKKIELLQSSWMLVNPSLMEGWGIVAIEANASGTPVIASNVPGLRDSVLDGKAGYLLPYGDVGAFAETILSLIRDRELRESFENNGRIWAKNFNWQESSSRFLGAMQYPDAVKE